MSKIIQQIEAEQMNKRIPDFKSGDTVVVQTKVKEGDRERLQAFEGVVIAKRGGALNASFVVRKISHGEGVERTFQTYSPMIDSIQLVRRGDVRKAKLYYLRDLSGKKARIKEKVGGKANSFAALVSDAPSIAEQVANEAPVEPTEGENETQA